MHTPSHRGRLNKPRVRDKAGEAKPSLERGTKERLCPMSPLRPMSQIQGEAQGTPLKQSALTRASP